MSISKSASAKGTLKSTVDALINLADESIQLMDAGTIKRLRNSTRQYILLSYGQKSHLYRDYLKIANINSQYYIGEIKGILLSIKDDIVFKAQQNEIDRPSSDLDAKKLAEVLLSLFYKNGIYNLTAIRNLIMLDSAYFEFTVEAAEAMFQKFIARDILAYTGMGEAYCITEEGKRFYERTFKQANTSAGEQNVNIKSALTSMEHRIDKNETCMQTMEVFLSYSWDSALFQEKVAAFVNFLREKGYEAKMDLMLAEEQTAIDFARMMHVAIQQSQKVIIVLSKGYKEKAENFTGGVGMEYLLLFKDIEKSPQKYILVAFEGITDDIIPFGLRGREIVDCLKQDWEQKIFSKLSDEGRYAFSAVGSTKPVVEKIVPGRFMKDVEKKTTKARKDNAAKIKASLRMEKRIKKDLVDHSMTNGRSANVGMFPGTYTPFISGQVIIRSVEDEHYPYVDETPDAPMSSWIKEHFYDLSNEGIDIWIAAAMGHHIIMNKKGYWELLQDHDDSRKSDPRYKSARIMIIGTIPYYNIVEYRIDGDDYYNDPHIFCYFTFNGTPYSKIKYKVYYDEHNELPTSELDLSKKTQFEH